MANTQAKIHIKRVPRDYFLVNNKISVNHVTQILGRGVRGQDPDAIRKEIESAKAKLTNWAHQEVQTQVWSCLVTRRSRRMQRRYLFGGI